MKGPFVNLVKFAYASTRQLNAKSFSCTARVSWNARAQKFGPFSSSNGNGLSWDVQRFLEEIGTDGKEARYWLKLFRFRDDNPQQPFAVLKVSSSVFKRPHMLNNLGSSLAFLQRNGLNCIIIHGTEGEYLAREVLLEQTMQLSDVLESQGAKTRPLLNCSGVLQAEGNADNDALELNTEPLTWCLGSGYIPILSSLAETKDGRMIRVCPIRAADQLAAYFKPMKVMYLNSKGGLINEKGKVVEVLNMPVDYLSPTLPRWYSDKTYKSIGCINELLKKLPFTSSVVITSADAILKELFTHRGSGTIFKKREALNVYKDFSNIDTTRLVDLIQRTFGRTLTNDYLQKIENKLLAAYITESYSAAAIITAEDNLPSVPYLDKFAVSLQNQGLGAGETLWEKIRKDFPKLFWRSKGSNRINPWYFTRSEGSWTNNSYTVFWYGVNKQKISNEIVNFAISHPSSFEDHINDESTDSEEIFANSGST